MAENLMNSAHKATNEKYREHYDDIFRKRKIVTIVPCKECHEHPCTCKNEEGGLAESG